MRIPIIAAILILAPMVPVLAVKTDAPLDTDLAFPEDAASRALIDDAASLTAAEDSAPRPDTAPARPRRPQPMPVPAVPRPAFTYDTSAAAAPASADTQMHDTAHISYYSRIYSLPAAAASVLGMVTDSGVCLVSGEQGDWYRIRFGNQEGWVRKTDVLIYKPANRTDSVAATDSAVWIGNMQIPSTVTTAAQQARESVWVVIQRHPILISVIGGAALLAFLAGLLLRRKAPASVKRQVSAIALANKKILMAGGHEKTVKRAFSDEAVSIETVFAEEGFAVSVFEELDQLGEALGILIPSLVAVDCRGSTGMISRTERLLMRRVTLVNVPVLFYNVPGAENAPRSAILPHTACLGALPTDWDVLKALNALHSAGGSPRAIRKSIGASVLEGSIKGERLTELFQFFETGKRTGCLLAEHAGKPFGMVYFDKGRIVRAQTRAKAKVDAVLAVLELASGTFRFMADRTTDAPDCDFTATGIMLEWTKRADETQHMIALKGEQKSHTERKTHQRRRKS